MEETTDLSTHIRVPGPRNYSKGALHSAYYLFSTIFSPTPPQADSFSYIVDEQPIGQVLFRQFCVASRKPYHHYNDFIDAVDNYETEIEENRVNTAINIVKIYLTKTSGKCFQHRSPIHARLWL